MLAAVTACAVLFAVVAQAIRGSGWAIAMSVACASVVLILATHVGFFLAAMTVSSFFSLFVSRKAVMNSPFAQDRPPPQWVEPSEPEG